mmetsp:Transcript_2135/g.4972  ORF Transcript_2135/g.4972 Transcript_2135/m.4972 type:complete len:234 (-) Transcript_2135:428-1129(-)
MAQAGVRGDRLLRNEALHGGRGGGGEGQAGRRRGRRRHRPPPADVGRLPRERGRRRRRRNRRVPVQRGEEFELHQDPAHRLAGRPGQDGGGTQAARRLPEADGREDRPRGAGGPDGEVARGILRGRRVHGLDLDATHVQSHDARRLPPNHNARRAEGGLRNSRHGTTLPRIHEGVGPAAGQHHRGSERRGEEFGGRDEGRRAVDGPVQNAVFLGKTEMSKRLVLAWTTTTSSL